MKIKKIASTISTLLQYSITPILLLVLLSCSPAKEKLYKETRLSMYTVVSITVAADSEKKAGTAIDSAFKEMERLGRLLNFYADDSEISLVNRNAGIKPVRVSKETLDIIDKALFVAETTDGAFDITIGSVVKLWDFNKKVLPDKDMLKERLKLVGYKNIALDKKDSTVFLKKKEMQIDLGGIIKGYAADKAVDVLKRSGIRSGIVSVGGEVKAFGSKPQGGFWKVGIKNPRQKNDKDEIIATVNLSDMAISTSGDYEKFFEKDGKWYHHLLSPKTGYPVYECQGVSIITRESAFADAFATGIFVLGPEKGMDTLKKLGFDGVIVDSHGNVSVTEGIKDKIELKQKKT
ncbi:MAG: FAD:protein FMN transferase [Nitrospirae bacterium]|nr:FAD:protein FMN transferase [Nitrospirota bacterium]